MHVEPDPARALRDALRSALQRPPCVVAFSVRPGFLAAARGSRGPGRARGSGPPTALTLRYPGDPAADESHWPELVVAHLRGAGLRFRWECRDITTELDLIGPLTAPVLREYRGPTFPAGLGNTILLAQHARGGCLVTGNAGDEVLGGHRAGVLRTVLRRRGRGLTLAGWRQWLSARRLQRYASGWGVKTPRTRSGFGLGSVPRCWVRPRGVARRVRCAGSAACGPPSHRWPS